MAEAVSIKEELARRGRGFFQTAGDSMEPLLHDHYSTVVIEKVKGRLEKGDVALFYRPGGVLKSQPQGRYVLHRVVKVLKKGYLICGDNRFYKEKVPEEWIVGVMVGFFNGEAYTSCGDEAYRGYVERLNATYWARWCRAFPGRVVRKLRGWSR